MSKKHYRVKTRHSRMHGTHAGNIDVKTVAGIVVFVATILALFIVIVLGSQWFKLPLAEWFSYWGTKIVPTGIKISPDKIIVG